MRGVVGGCALPLLPLLFRPPGLRLGAARWGLVCVFPGDQAPAGDKYFKIYRWNPDKEGEKPYMATYPVNTKECVAPLPS
jgi:hypothetical protein